MQHWLPFLNNSTPHLNPRRSFLNQEHRVQIFPDQKESKYISPSNIRASVETRPPQLHSLLQFSPALSSLKFYGPSPWASQGSAIKYTYFQYIVIRQSLTIILPPINFGYDTFTFTIRVIIGKWCWKGSLKHHNVFSSKACRRTLRQGSDLLQRDGFFTFFSSCWTFFGKQCWPGWLLSTKSDANVCLLGCVRFSYF